MRKNLYVVANWKMNPTTVGDALKLLGNIKKTLPRTTAVEVVVAPPSLFLSSLRSKFRNTFFAAQTVAQDDTHAHTGLLSSAMYKHAGASYAIIGHSEVRQDGVTNERAGEMLREALKIGLTPILCVGEKSRDHNGFYLHEIQTQIEDALRFVPKTSYTKIILAYEPLWAIGKDALREATPPEFREIAIFIRKVFSDIVGAKNAGELIVLYGGSADEKNAHQFLEVGAQGFLVGRASLDAKKFSSIVSTVETFSRKK